MKEALQVELSAAELFTLKRWALSAHHRWGKLCPEEYDLLARLDSALVAIGEMQWGRELETRKRMRY